MSHSNPGLSAKARGKRRALPDQALCINIRFTWPDTADLSLVLSDTSLSVREFKHACILPERPALADKKLRLIYLGRILSDGVLLLPWLEGIIARQQGQAEGRHSGQQGSNEASPQQQPGKSPDSPIWLNCSVAEVSTRSEEFAPDANAAEQGSAVPTPARGCQSILMLPLQLLSLLLILFDMVTLWNCTVDRLQEAGFSAEEIETLRREFQANRSDAHLEHGPIVGGDDEHARAMEELWMDRSGNQEPTEACASLRASFYTLVSRRDRI